MTGRTPGDSEETTDNAHLYRGLNAPPSAHRDPPASALGPEGERVDVVAAPADDMIGAQGHSGAIRPNVSRAMSAEPAGYDEVSPRTGRRPGGKTALGVVAVLAAALAYILLPKFGFGPGSGKGGSGPGNGSSSSSGDPSIRSVSPAGGPSLVPSTTTSSTSGAGAQGRLMLTIQMEKYRVGGADGREITLEEAIALAAGAKPDSPVVVDLNDSSRALAEENLRAAFEKHSIPLQWTKDGKPITGEVPGKIVPVNP